MVLISHAYFVEFGYIFSRYMTNRESTFVFLCLRTIFWFTFFEVLIVIQSLTKYKCSNHPFRLRLPCNANVKKIEEVNNDIPYEKFNFLNFEDLEQRAGLTDYLCDTYGLLIDIGFLEQVRTYDVVKKRRTIHITNSSGKEMEVLLWETTAENFPENEILLNANTKPVVLVFAGMIPKSFKDSFSLNSSAGTKIYINLPLDEITAFLKKIAPPFPKLKKVEHQLKEVFDIETEKMTNRKGISELLQVDIHTDKDIKFTCKAKIKEIDASDGWWYRACPDCKSGIQITKDQIWCKNHRFIEKIPLPWYRIKIIVEDETGTIPFIVFGNIAEELIGVQAHTLTSTFKERHEIPPSMTKICGTTKIFQIQLSNTIEDPSQIIFKVLYIFKEDAEIPKKEMPSPVSAPTTHLKCLTSINAITATAHRSLDIKDDSTANIPSKKRKIGSSAATSGEKKST